MSYKIDTKGTEIQGVAPRMRFDDEDSANKYLDKVKARFNMMIECTDKGMKFGLHSIGDLRSQLEQINTWTVEKE
jgi:hypothetical protein